MPQLIQGHVRFTAEDFLLGDYQTRQEKNSTPTAKLVSMLKANSEQLAWMKDPTILEYFNTTENIKKILTDSLSIVAILASKEGYTLAELMR